MTDLPSARQTRRNVVFIWLNRVLAGATPLVITPIITHSFGLERTGIWLLATQAAAHLMLLDIGFANSLIRHLARARSLADPASATAYVTTAFVALAGVGALLLVVSPWLASAFVRLFAVSSPLVADAWRLGILTVAFVAVSLPFRVGYGLLNGAHRFDRVQVWEGLGILLRLVIVLAVFHLTTPTLLGLGLIVFGSTLLPVVAIFFDGLRMNRDVSMAPRSISSAAFRGLGSMGGAALTVTAAQVVLFQGASVVAGFSLGPEVVPVIAYPIMIFLSLSPFFQTFPAIIAPIAASLSARNADSRLFETMIPLTRYLASTAILMFLGMVVGGRALLSLWLSGPELTAGEITSMAVALAIILFGFAYSMIGQLARAVLTSIGRHWQAGRAELVTSILGIAVGYVLMLHTDMGVLGMAAGIAAAMLARGLLWFPLLVARHFKRRVADVVWHSLGTPTAAGGIFVIAAVAMRILTDVRVEQEENVLVLAATHIPAFAAWVIFNWLFVLTDEHRRTLLARWRR